MGRIRKPWLSLRLGEELEQRMGACSSDHSGEKAQTCQEKGECCILFLKKGN